MALVYGYLDAQAVARWSDDEPIVPIKLAGDKGYRADWIDEILLGRGINPVIPSRENEDRTNRPIEFDKDSYRRRSIIENLIGWLKECRGVATRFKKRAVHYLSMVKLSMICRFLRQFCPDGSRV